MSRKKISTTIYVTPEQADRLKVLHERTKVPVAVYIREGIDLVLRQYDHLLPGQLPLDSPAASSRAGSIAPPSVIPGSVIPSSVIPSEDATYARRPPVDADDEEQTRAHAPATHGHAAAHAASKK